MSWQDYALARELLFETFIGTRLRQDKAVEDAEFKRSIKAMPRG